MLINKLITNAGYVIVSSVDPATIKYFLDLGSIPIVAFELNLHTKGALNEVEPIINKIFTISYSEYGDVTSYLDSNFPSNFRPLNLKEIKTLYKNIEYYIVKSDVNSFVIKYLINTRFTYNLIISRDSLCEKL